MKKLLCVCLFAACLLTSAFAISWSGLVDNNTRFAANNDFSVITLRQSNGVYLSLSAPISKNGNLKLSAEGLYKYNFDSNFKTNTTSFKNIADCDLFNLSGSWKIKKNVISLNAGRFMVSDYAGNAFAQVSDGLFVGFSNAKMAANIYGGYTGLLNRLNVSMTDNSVVTEKDEDFYRLCPQYIPVMADISFKGLFKKHTLGIQGEAFIPASDKLAVKAYGTVLLKGPVNKICNYKATFTFGTVKFEKFMYDAIADLNFFVIPHGMLTAGIEYTSSEKDSLLNFTTVTSRSLVNDPYFAGGILPKLAILYSQKSLYASLTGKGVVAIANDTTKFRGIDASADVVYNIFNDLQIGCSATAFIGIGEADKASNYSATIKAKLAF